jgi:UDPglucose 6-dehydrogenase/GDP-mannose 6-dehydrogenase
MKISVVGTGYVGLVSGVCLAAKGHEVVCIDIDQNKVDMINRGEPPIYEEGLEDLLKQTIGKTLRSDTDLKKAVQETDLSLIAVGTPFRGDEIDLKFIEQVSRDIGAAIKEKDGYHVVVVKSTVVPGTTDSVVLPLLEEASGKKAGVDFGVGMNPEFLREGVAVSDFMDPDRIVLGGIDQQTLSVMDQLYTVFEGVEVVHTNPRTAEMIKYTANSLLATMISFSNEIGNLSATVGGIDVSEVMAGVHLDKRLSPILEDGTRVTPSFTTYIEAGCGFGGSCFPKDVKALIAHGKKFGQDMTLLDSVIQVNEDQPNRMLELLTRHFPDLGGITVAVLGLAFKPGTDDIRESPAIPIIAKLLEAGAIVQAFDPIAEKEMKHLYSESQVAYCETVGTAIHGAQAVLLVTRWPEFSALPGMIDDDVLLVDGRRMLPKDSVSRYEGIGL